MTYYIPKYFILEEWFPEVFFKAMYPVYGKRLWTVIDWSVLWTADRLRKRYGILVMNTWHSPKMIEKYGRHEWRGFRDHTSPYVAKSSTGVFGNISQHRFGRAEDAVPLETNVEDIRKDIQSDPFCPDFRYVMCVEMQVSWLHWDNRNHNKEEHGLFLI